MSHKRLVSLAALSVAGLALAAVACMGVSQRSNARAEVDGPDGTPVQVVTSTEFVRQRQSSGPTSPDTAGVSVQLVSADTSRRTLPTTVSRSLTETQRFYIGVVLTDSAASNTDGSVDARIHLFVDGEQRAQASGDLLDRPIQVSFTSFVSG